MGPGGYAEGKRKWTNLEEEYLVKGIIPEPYTWDARCRDWFYGHGGTLDAEGLCIYNQRHKENPLPIQALRDANRDAREGRFIPDRDNDELTRALGNAEHSGRVRATEGSLSWSIGFPEDKKRYPDRSHKRRKEKEASEKRIAEEEKRIAADHLRAIEERFRNIEARLPPAARLEEPAFDGTGGHQLIVKSSVASTEVAATTGDDAHTMEIGRASCRERVSSPV